MKLLSNTTFDAMSSVLSTETSECRIESRIEAYSCKLIVSEKKQYKYLGGRSPHEREPLAPPVQPNLSRSVSSDPELDTSGNSPMLLDSVSRKTLFYLTATLNASFPDYDFTDVDSERFSKEQDCRAVVLSIDNKLRVSVPEFESYRQKLWSEVNEVIDVDETTVYTYAPDFDCGDPFSVDGLLWSFNYLFYNKKRKRIILFACRALSNQAEIVPDEYQTQWSMEGI